MRVPHYSPFNLDQEGTSEIKCPGPDKNWNDPARSINISSHVRLCEEESASLDALSSLNEDVLMGGGGEEENKEEDSSTSNLPTSIEDNEWHNSDRPIVCYFNYVSLHVERNGYLSYRDMDLPSVDALYN